MEWLWLGFSLFAGFAMLSVLGGERQRRINAIPPEPAHPAAETPAADARPHS